MAKKPQRISSHTVETRSRDNIRSLIDYDGTALLRDLTERDYGIDAIMELFEGGNVTGKLALLQLKGKEHRIVPLKDGTGISCTISASNAAYAFQKNIPVILIYASLEEKENFYYIELQKALSEEHLKKLEKGQKNITIRIPIQNCVAENGLQSFFDIVNTFYQNR